MRGCILCCSSTSDTGVQRAPQQTLSYTVKHILHFTVRIDVSTQTLLKWLKGISLHKCYLLREFTLHIVAKQHCTPLLDVLFVSVFWRSSTVCVCVICFFLPQLLADRTPSITYHSFFVILKLPISVRPPIWAIGAQSLFFGCLAIIHFPSHLTVATVCVPLLGRTVLQSEPLLSAKCTLGGTKHGKK